MTVDNQPDHAAPTSSEANLQQYDEPSQVAVVTKRPFPRDLYSFILILLVLLLGAYFRFSGLDWDQGTHLHPDERFLTGVTTQIQSVTDPVTYLRTSESPLNPYNVGQSFYVYGNFPMTVTRIIGEWATNVCTAVTSEGSPPSQLCAINFLAYDGVHLLGRFLSGLVDLISILFIFLIGRRLYDGRVGLLAALLLATAVMPIQQSHFYTMDNWAAAMTTIAVYTAVRAAGFGDEKTRWHLRWWVLFGLALGLATASRINVAPIAIIAPVAAIIWLARRGYRLRDLAGIKNLRSLIVQQAIIGLAVAALVSLLTFRLAQPYAFADATIARQSVFDQTGQEPGALNIALRSMISFNPQWLANMEEIQRLQQPEASFPPAVQWTDREPILFPLTNMILYGMGLTAGLAAWAGFLWALWRIVNARPDWMAHVIPVAWSGFYFVFMGTRWVKSVRYFLPIYPTLLLLAAWLLLELWRRASSAETRSTLKRVGAVGLMALTIIPSLLWANTFIKTYTEPFTRLAASDWIFENIPSGVTILYAVDQAGLRPVQSTLNLPLKNFDFYEGSPLNLGFSLPEDGVIHGVRFNYLTAISGQPGQSTLQVQLNGADYVPSTFDVDGTRRQATIVLPDTAVSAHTPLQLTIELDPSSTPINASTSLLVNEAWDDLLPVNSHGRSAYGSYYTEVTGGQRPLPFPDNEDKRAEMIQWLDEADYIPISSQRAIWSIPRLPLTNPMTMRYYEALFSGELGFDLVAQFQADFQIGPLYISDTGGKIGWGKLPAVGWPPPGKLAAEEAFSVYDHPPVWVFAKTNAYNHDNTVRILNQVDLSQVVNNNPAEATNMPNGLMLSTTDQAIQQANGTFNQIFNVDGALSQQPALAAVVWWLAVILLGWLAFPLTFTIFRGLPDRGYALARILSLLLISYFGWLMASAHWLPNSRGTLLLGALLVGLISLLVYLRRSREIADFVRQNLTYIGIVELLGIGLFLLMILVRLGNPDVWDVIWGGEKPMDLSYFTAVLKSTYFPPYDPWFAGGYINYYYYGFVYVGVLTKLLGIIPAVAYNLILPMLYSFTGVGVFSITYNLAETRDRRLETNNLQSPASSLNKKATVAGLIATSLAILLGNLAEVGVIFSAWRRAGTEFSTGLGGIDGLLQTLDGAVKIISGQPSPLYAGDWFWTASRAINVNPGEVGPITEFPFFTFLYGDLHAHMISLPLAILALGWAVSLALTPRSPISQKNQISGLVWWETALLWLTGGLAVGVLRASNTWDWPTYLGIGVLAIVFYGFRQHGRFSLIMVGQTAYRTAVFVGLFYLTFLPYDLNFGSAYTSIKLWPGSYTQVGNYLAIYGLFLFLVVTHLVREFRNWTRTWRYEDLQNAESIAAALIGALLVYLILLVVLVSRGYLIAPIVLTLVIIAGLLGLRRSLPPSRRIILILISAALFLTLFVEIFVLDGDIGRMNTVFKFYMQVWIILSVVGGVTAVWAWPSVKKMTQSWPVSLAFALAFILIYPIISTPASGILYYVILAIGLVILIGLGWIVTRQRPLASLWQGTLAILVLAAALYPLLATKAKWDIRMSKDAPNTLDGMAFMPYVEYSENSQTVPLEFDYDAIQWMHRNINGSPVIAEAHSSNPYRSISNRVAMYTGLPTIIGWDWHQRQQRAVMPGTLIGSRINDVNQLYNTSDMNEALAILEKYNISYVYAGQLEWVTYQPQGLVKFDQMVAAGYLEEVYRNDGTSIYKVKRASLVMR